MTWTKYKIEKKQQFSGGTWVDVYPLETRDVALETYDTEEECEGFRWVIIQGEYRCVGVDKHYVEKEQTYINGNWIDTSPLVTRIGSIFEANSFDCGYIAEEWRNTGTMCDGIDKYYVQTKYISDNGNTWTATTETRKGDLIESQSVDCLTPDNYKAVFYTYDYDTGGVKDVIVYPCDGNTVLNNIPKIDGTWGGSYELIKVGNCVTEIANYAFDGTGVFHLELPQNGNLTRIGNDAFSNTSLGYHDNSYSVIIPDTVQYIGIYAFYCVHVTYFKIGSGCTYIGVNAFDASKKTRLVELTSPAVPTLQGSWGNTFRCYGGGMQCTSIVARGLTTIGDYAFNGCSFSLKEVQIENGCTSIGNNAFKGCRGLTSIDIPDSVTTIGNNAFSGCSSLTSCTLGSGVTTIGENAFTYCTGITTCTLGSDVTSIGTSAFTNCWSLTSINIPNSVTTIGIKAFYDCNSLTSCTIGSGVTTIGGAAFEYCSSLTSITCLATTPPGLSYEVFVGTNKCPIYVPSGSVGAYKSASGWRDIASRIQAIPT